MIWYLYTRVCICEFRQFDIGITRRVNKKESYSRTMSGMDRLVRLPLPPLTINNYPVSLMISRNAFWLVELRPMASLVSSLPLSLPPSSLDTVANLCLSLSLSLPPPPSSFSPITSVRSQRAANAAQRVHPRASGRSSSYRFVVTFRRTALNHFVQPSNNWRCINAA